MSEGELDETVLENIPLAGCSVKQYSITVVRAASVYLFLSYDLPVMEK